jgi:hypothetical protein
MYATEVFGGMGTLFTPSKNLRGRYTFGIVTEPHGLAQPYLIATNGKLAYEELSQARYTGLVAKANIPMIPIPGKERDDLRPNIKVFLEKVTEFLSESPEYKKPVTEGQYARNIHQYMNMSTAHGLTGLSPGQDVSIRKLLTKTWPKLKPNGFVTWRDNNYRYLACEASWFDSMINNIQYHITTQMQIHIHGGFQLKAYGLGTVKPSLEGMEVEYHPSIYTSFFSDNTVKAMLVSDSRTNNDRGYAWMYLHILASQLRKMSEIMGGVIKGQYTMEDYLAFASEIVASKVGYGESSMNLFYQGTDISGQVRDEIGSGIAMAYPWQDFTDEVFEEILEFWIVKAIVCARIKAFINPHTIELGKGDKIRAAFDFKMESGPELPGVGSEGQPYMFMPTNRPGDRLLLPMALVDDDSNKKNTYNRQLTRSLSVSKTQVKMSEIQGNPLEPTNTKETFLQWIIENDSRRWEITYPWYKLYVWRFPTAGWGKLIDDEGKTIVDNNNGQNGTRRYQTMLYLLSQMAQGESNYADGYFIHNHIGLYGSVAAPYTFGPANPIQQAISDKPISSMTEAKDIATTPRPEKISISETSPATLPAETPKNTPTQPEAEQSPQATPPVSTTSKDLKTAVTEQK